MSSYIFPPLVFTPILLQCCRRLQAVEKFDPCEEIYVLVCTDPRSTLSAA